jgi:transposase-like protein
MPHGQPRDSGKEQFWRDVLRRWHDSGLTIRAYCRQRSLAEPSFYFWRRELAQRDLQTPLANSPAVTFVPLTVRPEPVAVEAMVEVVLANGRRLRVPVGVAADVVREWVAVLEETPCSA